MRATPCSRRWRSGSLALARETAISPHASAATNSPSWCDTSKNGATSSKSARTISTQLKEPVAHRNYVLDCGVSIGAATFPRAWRCARRVAQKRRYRALRRQEERPDQHPAVRKLAALRTGPPDRDDRYGASRRWIATDVAPFYQPKVSPAHRARSEASKRCCAGAIASGAVHFPAEIEAAFEDLDLAHEISERMQDRVIERYQRLARLRAQVRPGRHKRRRRRVQPQRLCLTPAGKARRLRGRGKALAGRSDRNGVHGARCRPRRAPRWTL